MRGWRHDLRAALGGLALMAALLYAVGAATMAVRMADCEDQCEADRLAAHGRHL